MLDHFQHILWVKQSLNPPGFPPLTGKSSKGFVVIFNVSHTVITPAWLSCQVENSYSYKRDTDKYWECLKMEEITSMWESKNYFPQRVGIRVEPWMMARTDFEMLSWGEVLGYPTVRVRKGRWLPLPDEQMWLEGRLSRLEVRMSRELWIPNASEWMAKEFELYSISKYIRTHILSQLLGAGKRRVGSSDEGVL